MGKGVKLIIAAALVAAVAVTVVMLTGSDKESQDTGNQSEAQSAATVTYDGESFSPAEVTVESGGTVTFVNQSDTDVAPASDVHPTHTNNPEINFGTIAPGDSKELTVSDRGEWAYHNHLDAGQTGMIIVQ